MAGAKNHDYHILPPSIWPLIGAFSALAHGGRRHHVDAQGSAAAESCSSLGVIGVLFTMFSLVGERDQGSACRAIIRPVVQLHLRYGMILFIASEVMFFVGWFWAFFDFSLFPAPVMFDAATHTTSLITDAAQGAAQWPPKGIEVLNAFEFPLLNTHDPAAARARPSPGRTTR